MLFSCCNATPKAIHYKGERRPVMLICVSDFIKFQQLLSTDEQGHSLGHASFSAIMHLGSFVNS
jgi:hypothetical protein